MDVHLEIDTISKRFGEVTALDDVSLKVERGAFVCLLGPSGCGKTTLLRIIAGFEKASGGRLLLDGADIAGQPPHKRGFGMVFQSLALFPHMTVADNIAYGLKLRGVGAKARRDRVEELLDVIHLPSIADRPVSALSGGQRQRVAIARALAIRPSLFLLDEPLSALDAKLRDSMQVELRQLQQKFGVTTILVTHDQTEAMMLADQLVVMKDGAVRQADAPTSVYRAPADSFVADFLGSANILAGQVNGSGAVELLGCDTGLRSDLARDAEVAIAVRAEDLLVRPQTEAGGLTGTVEFMRDLGNCIELLVQAEDQSLRIRARPCDLDGLELGQRVGLQLNPDDCQVYPR